MTETTTTGGYAGSGIHEETARGRRRLEHMQDMCDEHTIETLAEIPINSDWHCLEIGAGAGSVAELVANRVPDGLVVATDLYVGFLPTDIPNLQSVQHDVRTDGFPLASFDFIHARAILQHLHESGAVLERILTWLKPGGWAVIEELDFTPSLGSPYSQLQRLSSIILAATAAIIGTDNRFGRLLPSLFRDAGLQDISATYRGHSIGSHGPAQDLLEASFEQLKAGIVGRGFCSVEEFEEVATWLSHNEVQDVALMTISVRGRKPLDSTRE